MKERLDTLLVKNNYFETIEKARASIMAGNVIVNEKKIDKCGTPIKVDEKLNIKIKGDKNPYVSRGGFKLEKAIKVFEMDFKDKIVLDIGASTGGFTDCALQNGASKIFAVDVGTNQLDYKLRTNPKVISIENTNIKDLILPQKVDIIVIDVSFISITTVFEYLRNFCKEDTKIMALIKPQFEIEREFVEVGGIISNFSRYCDIILKVIEEGEKNYLYLSCLDYSPIKGSKGNIEFISLFTLEKKVEFSKEKILEIIDSAKNLGGTNV